MEPLKDNPVKPYADNETQKLIHEFLDRIKAAKKTSLHDPNIQDMVFDCIYLLLRLGYDAQKLYQLSELSDTFLRTNFRQMELREPPRLLIKVPNNSNLPNNTPNERQSKYPGAPSKIESFLETIHLVEEQSQKSRSQSGVTPHHTTAPPQSAPISKQAQSEPPVRTISTEQNWLSKSKVSLTDSESDSEDVPIPEENTVPELKQQKTMDTPITVTQATETENDSTTARKTLLVNTNKNSSSSTNVTKLVSLIAYDNEEKKFQKVIKGRLTKLSNISFLSKNSSSHIEETRQKLLNDVNKFMDYVESLRNKEKKNFDKTHSTNHEDNSKKKLNVLMEQDSSQPEVLISDSFVKMTKVCVNFILFYVIFFF